MRSLGLTRFGEDVECLEFVLVGVNEYATEHRVPGIQSEVLCSCLLPNFGCRGRRLGEFHPL